MRGGNAGIGGYDLCKANFYSEGTKNQKTYDPEKVAATEVWQRKHDSKGNINVFEYLQTVLLYLPDYKNEPAGIEDLLPWSDFIKERCSADRKREFNKEN